MKFKFLFSGYKSGFQIFKYYTTEWIKGASLNPVGERKL